MTLPAEFQSKVSTLYDARRDPVGSGGVDPEGILNAALRDLRGDLQIQTLRVRSPELQVLHRSQPLALGTRAVG